jgi:hypothetical protein
MVEDGLLLNPLAVGGLTWVAYELIKELPSTSTGSRLTGMETPIVPSQSDQGSTEWELAGIWRHLCEALKRPQKPRGCHAQF